jgi:hypothetical protein
MLCSIKLRCCRKSSASSIISSIVEHPLVRFDCVEDLVENPVYPCLDFVFTHGFESWRICLSEATG